MNKRLFGNSVASFVNCHISKLWNEVLVLVLWVHCVCVCINEQWPGIILVRF